MRFSARRSDPGVPRVQFNGVQYLRFQEYNLNGSLALVGKHAAGSQLPGRG
jgi:hypothetical protein